MHPRDLLRAGLLTMILVGSAQARPNHSEEVTATLSARSPRAAALLAWKPRAWTPPARVQATAAQGFQVERDPVDGTLSMPAPDPAGAMLMDGERERRPVAVTRLSNGAYRAQLGEDFAEFAVVRIGPDGKPRWTCVQGPDAAARLLRAPAVPPREPAPGTVWEDK